MLGAEDVAADGEVELPCDNRVAVTAPRWDEAGDEGATGWR